MSASKRMTRWGAGPNGSAVSVYTDDGVELLIRPSAVAAQSTVDAWAERVRFLVDGTHTAIGCENAHVVDGAIAIVLPRGDSVSDWQAAQHLSLRIVRMEECENRLRSQVARLRDVVAKYEDEAASGPLPTTPVCVRQDARGVWALGQREKGWASFGFRYADWDELNRHWPNLAPCSVGVDEHGPYVELSARPQGAAQGKEQRP
jgi:hypothetical protein